MQVLVFYLADEAYAIPLKLVSRIRGSLESDVDRLLDMHEHLFGSTEGDRQGEIALLQLDGETVGMKADRIGGVQTLDVDEAWTVPAHLLSDQDPRARGIRGLLKTGQQWVMLLDEQALVTPSQRGED